MPTSRRPASRPVAARRRGLTLIELMVASAVSVTILSAAVMVLGSTVQQKRESERSLELQTVAAVTLAQLEFDIQNAGFRFPASAFAIHVYNDAPVAGSPALQPPFAPGPNVPDTCGPGLKFKPGTDAIELAFGTDESSPGLVQSVTMTGPGRPNVFYAGQAPFLDPDGTVLDRSRHFVLFTTPTGASCLGQHPVGSGPNGLLVQLMYPNFFTPVGSGFDPYNSGATNCPTPNSRAYRFAQRVRYFVCVPTSPPAGSGPLGALYRQASNTNPNDPDYGQYTDNPVLVQDGVDDLQIATNVSGSPTVHYSSLAPCGGALGILGGPPMCRCNDEPSPDTPGAGLRCQASGIPQDLFAWNSAVYNASSPDPTGGPDMVGLGALSPNSYQSRVTGVRLGVVVRGSLGSGTALQLRPRNLFDHIYTPPGAIDNVRRFVSTKSLQLPNINLVNP